MLQLGVFWGLGDFNAKFRADRIRRTLFRARKSGIEDPAKILSDEMSGARIAIATSAQAHQRLLHNGPSQLLLAAEEEDEDSAEDGDEIELSSDQEKGSSLEEDEILYDEGDDCSVYEL